jgi:1-aminocyclopropane-1-carboxylate deaminase
VLKIKAEEQKMFTSKHLDVNTSCFFDFAGKGYAKKDAELFAFMNDFFHQTGIPLDFVYTAKLLKAVSSLYDADYFSHTDRLLVIHTGGLQGNDSLVPGTLLY